MSQPVWDSEPEAIQGVDPAFDDGRMATVLIGRVDGRIRFHYVRTEELEQTSGGDVKETTSDASQP